MTSAIKKPTVMQYCTWNFLNGPDFPYSLPKVVMPQTCGRKALVIVTMSIIRPEGSLVTSVDEERGLPGDQHTWQHMSCI